MGKNEGMIEIDQFKDVIEMLNPCIDDYLYIMDLKNDYFYMSPNSLERFNMPDNGFYDAVKKLEDIVYAEDYEVLRGDIRQIIQGEKDFHNIQYRWLGKNREPIWINCRGRVVRDENKIPTFLVGCVNEIGARQKADNVSGLLLETSLEEELRAREGGCLDGFILRLGIDNFKEINESKGIDYGDMVLRKTAECIRSVINPSQMLYRVVADEFVVVDLNGGNAAQARDLYCDIRRKIDQFIENNHYEVFFTISAGILELDDVQNQEYHNLMKLSEFALNEAKNNGRNKSYIYNEEDYKNFQHKKNLIQIMRKSVNNNFQGFEAYFQPIVDINEKRLSSAETLLRFKSEETGMVSPVEFIPLLEESGLIIPVGRWVLERAMEACSRIRTKIPDFRVSVNLSYVQIMKSNVLEDILSGIEKYQLKEGSILIELTESGFLESNAYFIGFCDGLQENGIPLALDDFGTGYSNFHYLYNINPSTIKIDRSFTLKALNSDYEYQLLQHMVDMTHSIDSKLCIEGIETQQELSKICEMGPDYIQGYYFGKPCPLETFMNEFINK